MNVTVELGERSYDVVVEVDARRRVGAVINERVPHAKCVVLVTSPSLGAQSWFDIESGREQHVVTVPDGESAKTLVALEALLDEVAALRLSRDDAIVGVGGGAITDLAGFAAATYRRGVALVQVPTSLVGQVDAAIGGKTGVNLRAGKNLVGAFYQPVGVLCDTSVLATLPERERTSGLGEVAKCWLLDGRGAEELVTTPLMSLIELSVRLKAEVVADDERESGARALLNYGHTFAHALEKLALRQSPGELRHGEAVAVGLAFAPRLARELGFVGDDVVTTHDAVLDQLGVVRTMPPGFDTDELLEAMGHDKKAHHDLSFVLPSAKGFSVVSDIEESSVRRTLEGFKGET